MRKLIIGLCAALCGLALTANATAYTDADFTASADNTLTLTEDSTLTVGSDISIGKLTVEGSGYTLTLAGPAAVTATSLEIGTNTTVQLASGTTLADGALRTSTVTGAGVIGYTAIAPDALESWADEDNWTGTVWVQGLSQNAWNPTGLGNANSTLRLSGFTGYFAQAYITVPFAVELENSTYSSAMNVNNGFSYNPNGKAYFVTPTLKGSGTYTANTSGGSLFIVTDDWSGFTGTFALSGKTVWLGYAAPGTSPGWAPGDADVAAGTVSGGIRIAAGKSVDWNTSWTLAKFLGEGTIKMALPSEATPAFAGYVSDSSLWKGTVELAAHEATASTSIWPARMGNANSKVVLKGLTSNGGSHWLGDTTTINTTLDIEDEVTIDNGSGSAVYTIARLTGKGNLNFHANLSKAIYININAISNYTGSISAISGKDVVYVHAVELDAAPAVGDRLFSVTTTSGNRNVNFNKPFTYVNGELLTYSASLGEDGFYVTDVGRDVYWVGGASGNWHDNNNWELSDGTKTQPSTYNDDHVFITNAATIVLNDTNTKALCSHITIDADTTFIGGGNYAAYGLYFDQMDGTGAVTLSNVWVAIIASGTRYFTISNNLCLAEGSANYFNCGNMVCYLYGDLSGSGSLHNYMSYASSGVPNLQCGALRMYGTNSEFSGTFSMDTASNRSSTGFYGYGASSSGKASWSIQANNNTIQTESFIRDDGDYYFGALNGYLNVGDHAATLHIGGHANDSSVAISSRKDVRIVKTGDTTFEQHHGSTGNSTDNRIAYYDIYGGSVILNQILPTTAFKFLGDGGILMTPSYEVTVEEVASQYYPDPSALIKNSTAPIGFDTGAEDFTWATALAASNTGGLTKKGAGTLTLEQVPLFSGPVRVEEGTLIVPFGTQFESLYVAEGASVQVDLTGASETGVVLFSSGAKTGSGSISYVNVPDGYTVETINTSSGVIYANGTRTLTWCGPTADETDPENITYDYAWETASNWSPANVPTAIDNIVFGTATPGCVMSGASTVLSITAIDGLTITNAYALTVLGDMTVTGAFVKEGPATLTVGGAFSATEGTTVKNGAIKANLATAQSVAFDTDAYVNGTTMTEMAYGRGKGDSTNTLTGPDASGNGYGAKFVTPDADLLIVTGNGVVEAEGSLEVTSGTFAGTLAGGMGLAKSSDGTFSLFGNQTFEGDVAILGGTLKLATPLDLDGLRADFDASDADAFEYDETDGETIVKWNPTAAMSGFTLNLTNGYESTHYTDAVAPARTVDEDGYAYVSSEKFLMSEDYSGSKNDNYIARSFFFVAKTSSGNFAGNWEFAAASHPCRWGIKARNHNLLRNADGTWRTGGFWENGALAAQDGGYGGLPYPSSRALISAVNTTGIIRGSGYDNRMYIGGKAEAEWSEVLTYTRQMGFDEKAAVEQYLMAKWGIGDATYNALPATANVTLASGATLDLGGQTVTVASLTGAGTVQNGTLKTADNTVTVTGDLTIPVTDDTTYVIDNSMKAVRLTLTGMATGVTIEVSQTNNPVKVVTPDMNIQDEVTINVPAKWANYKTYSEHGCTIGRLPFVIRIR